MQLMLNYKLILIFSLKLALLGFIIGGLSNILWSINAEFLYAALNGLLIGLFVGFVEKTIFMFLDLTSATSIAEKLDPLKYSTFLYDFFHDLDNAITKTKGEVFQYVGDEVVAFWSPKNGLKNKNCIMTYFEEKNIFDKLNQTYIDKFGIVPTFKVALHYGDVTITEIGASKKEIAYHGDTINTTSRICSIWNLLQKKYLSRMNCLIY